MRLDFGSILLAIVVVFVVVGVLQLAASLPDAEHGLLLYERACPVYNGPGNVRKQDHLPREHHSRPPRKNKQLLG